MLACPQAAAVASSVSISWHVAWRPHALLAFEVDGRPSLQKVARQRVPRPLPPPLADYGGWDQQTAQEYISEVAGDWFQDLWPEQIGAMLEEYTADEVRHIQGATAEVAKACLEAEIIEISRTHLAPRMWVEPALIRSYCGRGQAPRVRLQGLKVAKPAAQEAHRDENRI